MSQSAQTNSRPISHTGILRLLAAAGAGAKIELLPEHISAVEAALQALAFQQQVKQLVLGGQPLSAPASPSSDRPEPRPADKGAQKRPANGSGAIWTDEEKAGLSLRWERGESIGQIAEEHKRTAMACFARLGVIDAIKKEDMSTDDESAAHFLIKHNQFVAKTNAAEWQQQAQALGWSAEPSPQSSRPMGPR